MALTSVQYVGNGSTSQFSVSFPFLLRPHVKVKHNGVILSSPLDYSWTNDSTIQLEFSPTSLETIELYRETPYTTGLVDFQNGANLTEAELNTAVRQLLYIFQEYNERIRLALDDSALNVATGGALVPVEGNNIFDDMVTHILDTNLSDTLQQRLADIDNNAQEIIDLAVSLTDMQASVDAIDLTVLQTAIDDLDALVAAQGTAITTEQTVRADADSALSASQTAITAAVDANYAAYLANVTTVANQLAAETTARELLGVSVADNTAAIVTEQTARADGDSANASLISALGVEVDANTAAIVTEQTARADGDSAEATARTALAAIVTTNKAAFDTEVIARATDEAAITSSITAVSAVTDSNTAAILAEQTARSDGDTVNADAITALTVSTDATAATVVSNATVAANASSANASDITALGVTVGNNTAAITTESTTRANADAALASDITTVQSSIAGNTAAITTEATTRASAVSTLTTDVTTAQETADGKVSTYYQDNPPAGDVTGDLWVDTNDDNKLYRWSGVSWIVVQDGRIPSLEARYGVKLDVNGYVTGFSQNNDGTTGSFKIVADQFKVIDPAGTGGQAGIDVFEVSEGYVTMKNIRSSATGARMQIDGDVIKVYDASNVLRVKLGNLA